MTNNEGPATIDGTFEQVPENKPNTPPQYNDGAMAAAFVKAGLPPLPEQETTPVTQSQPVPESQSAQNVSSPTPEVTSPKTQYIDKEAEASATNAAYFKAIEDAAKREPKTKPIPTNTPSTPIVTTPIPTQATPTMAKSTPVTPGTPVTPAIESTPNPEPVKREKKPKKEKTEPKKTDAPVEIEGAYKSIPEVDALKTNLGEIKGQLDEKNRKMVDVLIATLGNADVQKAMQIAIEEKKAADKVKQYTDKEGNLVDIPLPIKEEMDKTFDKNMRVADVERAGSYGNQENELYNKRIAERTKELKDLGYSDSQIEAYMEIGKHDIKLEIQQYVRGTVTRDFRNRVIDRIESNTDKYKDYIDPTTGKVIESIKDENLIGTILDQKVYPKWQQGELDAMRKKEEIEPPQPPKKAKRWGLIGGVIGFTAAVAGGASVGIPVTIGATVLSIGAAVAEKYAPKRIATLEARLANAQTPKEKENLEKRIKVWQFVNKHAHNTVKFFKGMAVGGGIGTFVSNIFMGGKGLVEIVGNNLEAGKGVFGTGQTPSNVENTPLSRPQGEAVPETTVEPGTNAGIESGNPASADPGSVAGNPIEAETTLGMDTSNGILVKGGRVELPGSAWDDNLATKPLGNLSNGALNHSNFTGGATNMGAFNLESALQSNGVTESLLRNNLQTPEIHRLLNIFTSNPSTDLSTALQSLNSEGAKTILEAISN